MRVRFRTTMSEGVFHACRSRFLSNIDLENMSLEMRRIESDDMFERSLWDRNFKQAWKTTDVRVVFEKAREFWSSVRIYFFTVCWALLTQTLWLCHLSFGSRFCISLFHWSTCQHKNGISDCFVLDFHSCLCDGRPRGGLTIFASVGEFS